MLQSWVSVVPGEKLGSHVATGLLALFNGSLVVGAPIVDVVFPVVIVVCVKFKAGVDLLGY